MTTRCILSAPHEAKALHEGRATAIVRRMEPQPIDQGDYWEWRPKGSKEISDGLWVPCYSWCRNLRPTHTGAASIEDACPHGRIGDVLEFRRTCSHVEYIECDDAVGPEMRTSYVFARRVIVSIDVIRVAETTQEQAKACGYTPHPDAIMYVTNSCVARDDYESLHGDGSWLRDWAWLIGLKGVEG